MFKFILIYLIGVLTGCVLYHFVFKAIFFKRIERVISDMLEDIYW